MEGQKRIGLAAHDAVKAQLGAWAFANEAILADHVLTATGNTGRVLLGATSLDVTCLRSGTLGGDMELGALIADNQIDILILFADPLTRQSHDLDPAPLLRIATIAQIAVATTETTADFIIRSELLSKPYYRRAHDSPALQPAQRSITQRQRS